MGKYVIIVEEHVTHQYEVETIDGEEAMNLVEKQYNKRRGKTFLSGKVQSKQMAIILPQNEATEWTEF